MHVKGCRQPVVLAQFIKSGPSAHISRVETGMVLSLHCCKWVLISRKSHVICRLLCGLGAPHDRSDGGEMGHSHYSMCLIEHQLARNHSIMYLEATYSNRGLEATARGNSIQYFVIILALALAQGPWLSRKAEKFPAGALIPVAVAAAASLSRNQVPDFVPVCCPPRWAGRRPAAPSLVRCICLCIIFDWVRLHVQYLVCRPPGADQTLAGVAKSKATRMHAIFEMPGSTALWFVRF